MNWIACGRMGQCGRPYVVLVEDKATGEKGFYTPETQQEREQAGQLPENPYAWADDCRVVRADPGSSIIDTWERLYPQTHIVQDGELVKVDDDPS